MDLFSRIKPEETNIHAMLERIAMMAGERPRNENLCDSSFGVPALRVLGKRG